MKHLLAAALLLGACGVGKPDHAAHTGPPATEPLAMSPVRPDFAPGGTTTTTVPLSNRVTAATVAPPVVADISEVRPLATTPPVRYGTVWDDLAQCESHGEWDYGPHSTWGSHRFEGGLQFHPATWDAYKPAGYPEAAYQASREQQIVVGERVQAEQGWNAWPTCARKLGLL